MAGPDHVPFDDTSVAVSRLLSGRSRINSDDWHLNKVQLSKLDKVLSPHDLDRSGCGCCGRDHSEMVRAIEWAIVADVPPKSATRIVRVPPGFGAGRRCDKDGIADERRNNHPT